MYGDRLTTRGLNLLSAPGNDLVASTALAASGCHIVLFHHRTRNAFRHVYPHCQDFDKHRSIGKQTRLD